MAHGGAGAHGAPAIINADDLTRSLRAALQPLADNVAGVGAAAPPPAAPPPPPGGDAEREIKAPKFYNEPNEDFLEWKACAIRALEGKTGWNVVAKNRLLLSCMRRSAAIATQHLVAADYATTDLLFEALEQLFITDGGTTAARQQFRDARQEQNELILRWHTRVVNLYRRAHPGVGDVEANQELRERFIFGLQRTTLGKEVMRANPATLREALNLASRFQAIEDTYDIAKGRGRGGAGIYAMAGPRGRSRSSRSRSRSPSPERRGVNNLGRRGENRKCFGCKKKGHIRRNCPEAKRDPKRGRKGRGRERDAKPGKTQRPTVKPNRRNFSESFLAALGAEAKRLGEAESDEASEAEEPAGNAEGRE